MIAATNASNTFGMIEPKTTNAERQRDFHRLRKERLDRRTAALKLVLETLGERTSEVALAIREICEEGLK